MTIVWLASKIDSELIRTFRRAGWDIKPCTPADFNLCDRSSLNTLDIIVIEAMDRFWLALCEQICHQQIAPVLAIVGDLAYAQAALEAGADDFLVVPAKPIEALLRARKLGRSAGIVRVGDLEVDLLAWNVSRRGHRLHLSTVEFRLLASLAKRAGQIVDHTTILEEVWKSDTSRKTLARMTNYVGRVRRKIEPDLQNPQYIISVPRAGYRLRNQRQWEARQRESGSLV
jgi:DNA-binding response OmpR family regulator